MFVQSFDVFLLILLEIVNEDLYDAMGTIVSKNYPYFLRTNVEHQWTIFMNDSNEMQIDLIDVDLNSDDDQLTLIVGKSGKKID